MPVSKLRSTRRSLMRFLRLRAAESSIQVTELQSWKRIVVRRRPGSNRPGYDKEEIMDFRIKGLLPEPFRHLYGLSEGELARHGVIRYVVDKNPGYPDRIEMRDAEPGETV